MSGKNSAGHGKTKRGILLAVLAAALYALNAPFSKILLEHMPPTLMAGFLYLGAGMGMAVIAGVRKIRKTAQQEMTLTRREMPYTMAMILLDICSPQAMNRSYRNNSLILPSFLGS